MIIWEQFDKELKRFICQKVNHADHCGDILQEVYLKVLANGAKLERAQNIRSYLMQMARNAVADYYRLAAKVPRPAEDRLPDPVWETPEASAPGEYRLADCCLRPMIDALPEIYREALTLTELKGMSQKQYAEKAGISVSGAKSRVQRARERLKEIILQCCPYEFDKYGNIVSCCEN